LKKSIAESELFSEISTNSADALDMDLTIEIGLTNYFGELRFSGIMNYEWETATVEGFSAIPSDEFQKLTGREYTSISDSATAFNIRSI